MKFLWKFCGVNIVESVSSFVSVENYGSFVGLMLMKFQVIQIDF